MSPYSPYALEAKRCLGWFGRFGEVCVWFIKRSHDMIYWAHYSEARLCEVQ